MKEKNQKKITDNSYGVVTKMPIRMLLTEYSYGVSKKPVGVFCKKY
jgi:hypothetical protein